MSVVLFVGVVAGMVFFAFKYRRRNADELPGVVNENKLLEITWIVIPTILVLITFTWGFKAYIKLGVAPPQSYQIQTVGAQWLWNFTYPNGTTTTNELHVPEGRPVKLIMSSEDVIHSFYIPAFRVKHDVLPGRYTSIWFEATQTGEYDVFCTEYCGTQHSEMQSLFVAHDPDDYDRWLTEASRWWEGMDPVEAGALLYQKRGCAQCHSVDGSGGIGPTFLGSFGARRQMLDDRVPAQPGPRLQIPRPRGEQLGVPHHNEILATPREIRAGVPVPRSLTSTPRHRHRRTCRRWL